MSSLVAFDVKAKRFQRLGLKRLGLALARLCLRWPDRRTVEGVAHAVVVAGAARPLLRENPGEERGAPLTPI
jgi:hypothetical protein